MTGGGLGGLPAGDVCFLFTDVEGSTEILRTVGDARWAELRGRAHAAVIDAVRSHDGVVVNVEGDGCFAAFDDPARAAAACRQAQQALRSVDGDPGVRLRVRMGLHAGSGIAPRDGDYVALAVHRAARVCAAAHGGQVLATATVANSAPEEFTDLGLYNVRDFDGAVRLFALNLPADARPGAATMLPRVPAAFDARVPMYDTALVGRHDEIGRITESLARTPVLTLTGDEGVGKTRLAVAVLSEQSGYSATWFADLGGVSDPGRVGDVVALAVGCPPDVDLDAHLDAVLAGDPGLLVLDHCDHLPTHASDVARLLREWNPTLRVICTAREPLGYVRETVFEVAPLDVPVTDDPADVLASAAGRLFLERAHRAVADPELPYAIAPDVLRICRATGGNPLALELSAAMWGAGSAGALSAMADGSVAVVIDDAVRQLAEDDRAALAALAVAGQPVPHRLALAAVAAAGSADADSAIAELLHRCLIARTDEDGYRMPPGLRVAAARHVDEGGRTSVLVNLMAACLSATREPPVPVTEHDAVAACAAALIAEPALPGADRQRLAAQLAPWWSGRLGGRRARELLGEALALGRLGSATAAVHLAIARTFPPGAETVETERHVHEAARLLGEVDSVPPAVLERLRRTLSTQEAGDAPGT